MADAAVQSASSATRSPTISARHTNPDGSSVLPYRRLVFQPPDQSRPAVRRLRRGGHQRDRQAQADCSAAASPTRSSRSRACRTARRTAARARPTTPPAQTPFTPKVGLQCQVDPTNMYYFTYAKGFRPGGGNPTRCRAARSAARTSQPRHQRRTADLQVRHGAELRDRRQEQHRHIGAARHQHLLHQVEQHPAERGAADLPDPMDAESRQGGGQGLRHPGRFRSRSPAPASRPRSATPMRSTPQKPSSACLATGSDAGGGQRRCDRRRERHRRRPPWTAHHPGPQYKFTRLRSPVVRRALDYEWTQRREVAAGLARFAHRPVRCRRRQSAVADVAVVQPAILSMRAGTQIDHMAAVGLRRQPDQQRISCSTRTTRSWTNDPGGTVACRWRARCSAISSTGR